MRVAILHNQDFTHLPPGLSRNSQDAILGVATAVEAALRARGATVQVMPLSTDPVSFAPEFVLHRPDVVVNLCESLGGDSRGEMLVPGLLDLLGLPYTGSGPLALALALHKHKAKEILRGCGVPTPAHCVVRELADLEGLEIALPVIVKPAHEDASIGIDRDSVVRDRKDLAAACERILFGLNQPAIVEQYIEGREIYVSFLGAPPEPLPLSEIDFEKLDPAHPRIVTYAAKWDTAAPEFHHTPSVACTLPPELERKVVTAARSAFHALECRDYGRVDMRLSAAGEPYVIEVNPNCDLSPDAGYVRAAKLAGLDYEELVWRLVEVAQERSADGHQAAEAGRPGAARANARADRSVHGARGGVRARAGRPGAREA